MSVSFFRESKHILISPVSFLTSLDCHSSMLATIWVTVWTEVAVIDLPSEPLHHRVSFLHGRIRAIQDHPMKH